MNPCVRQKVREIISRLPAIRTDALRAVGFYEGVRACPASQPVLPRRWAFAFPTLPCAALRAKQAQMQRCHRAGMMAPGLVRLFGCSLLFGLSAAVCCSAFRLAVGFSAIRLFGFFQIEAPVGVEPTRGGFAVHCLTTWLRRPIRTPAKRQPPRELARWPTDGIRASDRYESLTRGSGFGCVRNSAFDRSVWANGRDAYKPERAEGPTQPQ